MIPGVIADARDQSDLAAVATKIGKALDESFHVNATELHSSQHRHQRVSGG